MASPAEQWKHSHNELHHTYTNVIGKDNDLGYGIMRVDEDQPWTPSSLAQPVFCFINAVFFEYGIAAYDLELGSVIAKKQTKDPDFRRRAKQVLRKIRKQATKDYVVHPALSIPTGSFLPTLAANFTANIVRNLWSNSVILCGHFPEGVETFEKRSIDGETKGEWYVRQMLGSANISGSKALHLMTGNLSHQVEHHLFPDLPSNRYGEIAPKVKALFDKYDLTYCTRRCRSRSTRLAQGRPPLAAQRLARHHQRQERAAAAGRPLQDGDRRPPHPPPARAQARERGPGDGQGGLTSQVILAGSRDSGTEREPGRLRSGSVPASADRAGRSSCTHVPPCLLLMGLAVALTGRSPGHHLRAATGGSISGQMIVSAAAPSPGRR